ncbi:DUF4438 domain-containing protein [Gemmatimonadota bacterium]
MTALTVAVLAAFASAPLQQDVTPVQYNADQLVRQAAQGFIVPARFGSDPIRVDPDGGTHVVPGTGSITYNFRSGDNAVNLAGDHVEPADGSRSSAESAGLNTLSCIGNRVRVQTGEAKGAIGYVIGKHGGAEHVMADFPDDAVFDQLTLDDKMHIYVHGVGMELTNFDGVELFSMSPTLMDALTEGGMGITNAGKLRVPVAKIVPARVMGSGLGSSQVYRGDYDIQMFDEAVVEEYGLDELRFGDIVAIVNAQHDYGRIYEEGSIAIGVIAHSNSFIAGHGPGVTSLMSSKDGKIEPMVTEAANLAHLLGIR